jgi:hypothetical protein
MNAEWAVSKPSPGRTMLVDVLQRHPPWMRTAYAFVVLMIAFAACALFDDRTFNGVSVWSKPFKFSLSIAVYFATLAWFAPLLPNGYIESRKGRWLTWTPIACAVLEIGYIALQAGRAEASHFNNSSVFYSVMYGFMGVGAVALVSICLWMGVSILRHRGVANPYVLAVGIGLVLTFLLGGGFGGYLGGQTSHWVGGTQNDANGIWLMKWSRDGGDLRAAHFFGMHAMQALPLLTTLLPGRAPHRVAVGFVVGSACVYTAMCVYTFIQALNGIPFF